jgi:uracil-DNA glycosylase
MARRAKPIGAQAFFPESDTLDEMREAAQSCEGCHLYQRAIQTVFGEGPSRAKVMMVGEQPGDQEDKKGHPFVGPAGRLLDKALVEAEIERDDVYVTNAVKHFKWKSEGDEEELPPLTKRRLHDKPNLTEVKACRPWLEAEIRLVQPKVVICLGATAVQAVLQRKLKIAEERGKILEEGVPAKLVTIHPSAIVRVPERAAREKAFGELVRDLAVARRYIQ